MGQHRQMALGLSTPARALADGELRYLGSTEPGSPHPRLRGWLCPHRRRVMGTPGLGISPLLAERDWEALGSQAG